MMAEVLALLEAQRLLVQGRIGWWDLDLAFDELVRGHGSVEVKVRYLNGEWISASKYPHWSWEPLASSEVMRDLLAKARSLRVFRKEPVGLVVSETLRASIQAGLEVATESPAAPPDL